MPLWRRIEYTFSHYDWKAESKKDLPVHQTIRQIDTNNQNKFLKLQVKY